MRRILLAWFAPLVLIAHTLITACVPAPILLLAQHAHIVIGKISPEAWVAHTQWHLKQVNGHFEQAEPDVLAAPVTGKIISAKGCDLQALQAYYAALRGAPQRLWLGVDWAVTGERPDPPAPCLHSPDLSVPHPPPRLALALSFSVRSHSPHS